MGIPPFFFVRAAFVQLWVVDGSLLRKGHIVVCPSLMRGVTIPTWYTTCTSSEWHHRGCFIQPIAQHPFPVWLCILSAFSGVCTAFVVFIAWIWTL